MKKFIIKISLFVVSIVLFILSLLLLIPQNKDNYLYEYHKKLELIDTVPSPRVILVGGSNLAFSIDSKMVSDSLGINVVNMGLHASIGLRYMLDSIEKYLRYGDTVIVMPEYSQFYTSYNGKVEALPSAFLYSLDFNPSILNLSQIMTVISGIPNHVLGNIVTLKGEWTYSANNFNKFGDEVSHRQEKSRKIHIFSPPQTKINMNDLEDFTSKINDIKNIGCHIMLMWPITIETNYISHLRIIDEISKELEKKNLNFSVNSDYFVQPDSMAFDTPYHLNGIAAEESAKRLITILKK